MRFSMRVAPGVRVSASSRGVRAHVGPRGARVHFGSGAPAVSAGVGPISAYVRGQSSGRSSRPYSSASVAKADEADRLRSVFDWILRLHHASFPQTQRPVAPEPPLYDAEEFLKRKEKAAAKRVSFFRRAARKAAQVEARQDGVRELTELDAVNARNRLAKQAELDESWERLLANDPEVVLGTLADAFADNDAPAAGVGVVGSELSLVTLVPSAEAVPDRRPDLTPAGNLTVKKLTKRESADFYKLLVCGLVLATVKEALAVAPRVTKVRVVAIRASALDAYGKRSLEVLLAATFDRARLEGVQWAAVESQVIMNDVSDELLVSQVGVTKGLAALDLGDQPELVDLLETIDFQHLEQRA